GGAPLPVAAPARLERALVHLLARVLLLCAVKLQEVHRSATEPRRRIIHSRPDAGGVALARRGGDEALAAEVAPWGGERRWDELFESPDPPADVVPRLTVLLSVGLVVLGVHLVGDVQPREGREEVGLGRGRASTRRRA